MIPTVLRKPLNRKPRIPLNYLPYLAGKAAIDVEFVKAVLMYSP